MTKQRLFILIGLFLFVSVAVFLVVSRTKQNTKTPPPPRLSSSSGPVARLPKPIPKGEPVEYAVSPFPLPTSVPRYTISTSPPSTQAAQLIAQAFDIATIPVAQETPEGVFYFFSSGDLSLAIGPNMRRINYATYPPAEPKTISSPDAVFIAAAQALLAKLHPFPPTVSLSPPSTVYFAIDGGHRTEAAREKATLIQLTFSPTIDGVPLLSGYPEESVVTFLFDADRRIISFSSPYVPRIQKTSSVFPLVSWEKARQQLVLGEGSLVRVFSDEDRQELTAASDYVFDEVVISGGELSLFWDASYPSLLPVYVLSGRARDSKNRKIIQTTTLISASE